MTLWQDELKEDFGPRVERHGEDYVLFSPDFEDLASGDLVSANATGLIDVLNGAMAVSAKARPLAFGSVIEFTSDGKRHKAVFAEGGSYALQGASARATAVALGPDGEPLPPPPPRPSEAQRLALLGASDALLRQALVYFGKVPEHPSGETGWLNIYKCFECLRGRAGDEKALAARIGVSNNKIELLRRTANWQRHAPEAREEDPPNPPMDYHEAREIMWRLLR